MSEPVATKPVKKTTFDKTREQLSLPEGTYTSGQESCFNVIAKKLPKSAIPHTAEICNLVLSLNLNLKQVEAGMYFLAANAFELAAFKTACGVGVTYTPEEIEAFITDAVQKNPTAENFKILSIVSKQFPWAEAQKLQAFVQKACENRVVQKEEKAEKVQKAAIPEGPTLMPLEQVYDIIPKCNRYEQLPEEQTKHEAFLKSINATILTRFPPEPNGYLHLGHAKSMFVNFGYAKLRGGKTYLRLDDTNPEKENEEYVEKIKEMCKWLGHEIFQITHASDYFQRLYDIAEDLIVKGHCYVDNQTPEQVAEFREKKMDPPCRFRPAEESLKLFREMRMGLWAEGTITLRMKIDMKNANPNMRDPIAYRIKFHDHQQSGDKWCIYPSYDYTHCLNDAFENITHSVCTLEFNIRRESYDWLTHIVGGYRPMQWEFSRLNITNTVMSKRRLLRLVNENFVNGWDDPRMPTLVGLRRRGFTPSVINQFCQLVGVSRNDQFIDYGLLEYVARQEFERTNDRAMAVLDPIKIELADYKEDKEIEYPLHPADASKGMQKIKFGKTFFIEQSAFMNGNATPDFMELALDQPCALRYGPAIYVKEVVTEKNGQIKIIATHSWDAEEKQKLFKAMKAQKKTLLHLHWISENDSRVAEVRLYDVLFKSRDPMEVEDWIADMNPNSLIVKDKARVPKYVAEAGTQKDGVQYKMFQFERLGFFVVDEQSSNKKLIFNRTVALKSSF
ncbi:Glutaminyl-tRNA_synthetase [Hexamita inflata]|uniref:glutamine--tRNA ligase n=1 Tax=Hexamita inflata TaxID=28002 RepID=A0AA86R4W4_9EUKA|nr:Glutaminyl-tRNA synthetase [Hexamita inflata]